MRVALLALLAACEFTQGVLAPADVGVDVPDVTVARWTIDSASGKATPRDAQEWGEFLAANSLSLAPPNALWTMQEASGNLADQIGSASLKPNGTPGYGQAVPGWSRLAIGTNDGDVGARFFNTTDATLPDVGATSITVLLYYATTSVPAQTRNVLFAGCCAVSALAHVDVTSSNQLSVTVATTTVTGNVDHGAEVVPLILQLDSVHGTQRVITHRETIDVPYTNLTSSRGIFIGSAGAAAPNGRWLYMAAWYGSAAEMDKATLDSLIDALGW